MTLPPSAPCNTAIVLTVIAAVFALGGLSPTVYIFGGLALIFAVSCLYARRRPR